MSRFILQRPFVPFEIVTVGGRCIEVRHSDFANVEQFVTAMTILDDKGRSQFIDTALIVSIRTLEPMP